MSQAQKKDVLKRQCNIASQIDTNSPQPCSSRFDSRRMSNWYLRNWM